MGNKICFHKRVILTEEIALYFKASNLVRDVLPIIEKWRSEGAELCFGLHEFGRTFDLVKDTERQFRVFDTDHNGRVDAHEILMVYILLSSGDMDRKIDAAFSTFDFNTKLGGNAGSISLDEAVLIVDACIKGVEKVCSIDISMGEEETLFQCKSMFDMHRLSHRGRLSRKQFREWCEADPSPRAFITLFDETQGLPDIYANVQRVNLEQGKVFQMLARGRLQVTKKQLETSDEFVHTLGQGLVEDEISLLTTLMAMQSAGAVMEQESATTLSHDSPITVESYHDVLRPWNIFNECDLDHSGELDDKEMELLIWIQTRSKPTQKMVKEFTWTLDANMDGFISREEWVSAVIQGNLHDHRADTPDSLEADPVPRQVSRSRASVTSIELKGRNLSQRRSSRGSMDSLFSSVGGSGSRSRDLTSGSLVRAQ